MSVIYSQYEHVFSSDSTIDIFDPWGGSSIPEYMHLYVSIASVDLALSKTDDATTMPSVLKVMCSATGIYDINRPLCSFLTAKETDYFSVDYNYISISGSGDTSTPMQIMNMNKSKLISINKLRVKLVDTSNNLFTRAITQRIVVRLDWIKNYDEAGLSVMEANQDFVNAVYDRLPPLETDPVEVPPL